MADKRGTLTVELAGGIIETLPPILQGTQFPGSLLSGYNFEPSTISGYRRISGFTEYDSAEPTGTGKILGVFVFNSGVIACRSTSVSFGAGSGWTLKYTQSSTPSEYLAERYNWSQKSIILVDGVNYPLRLMADGSTTSLTSAPQGATAVVEYANHMFFVKDNFVYCSEPNDETAYSTAAGAVIFNTGRDKTSLVTWRDSLYILGPTSIHKITGSSEVDFTLETVTEDLGTVAPRSIQEIGGDVWFLAYDGVRTIAGTDRNDDLSLSLMSSDIPNTMERLPYNSSSRDVVSVQVKRKEQYRLFIGDPTATTPALEQSVEGVLVGSRMVQGQLAREWFTTRGINPSCCDSLVESNDELVIHGGYDGLVYEQESGSSFNGVNVDANIKLPYLTFGDNNVRKTLYTAGIYIISEGVAEPTLSYEYDYLSPSTLQPSSISLGTGEAGAALYGTAVYGTSTYFVNYAINTLQYLVGSGKNVSFSVSSNDINDPYTIQTLILEYSLAGRR